MELEGNSQQRDLGCLPEATEGKTPSASHSWDNAPAHRGEAVREYPRLNWS